MKSMNFIYTPTSKFWPWSRDEMDGNRAAEVVNSVGVAVNSSETNHAWLRC